MPIKSGEELFVNILSHLHGSESRLLKVVEEMSRNAQNPDVKDLLDVRAHLTKQEISNIEECFKLIGKQPVQTDTRMIEVFAENTNRVLGEIQTPELRALYVLHKIGEVQNLHIAEYGVLVTMADLMDNAPGTILLERNLEDKITFVQRSRELIREIGKTVFVARAMRKAA